MHTRSGRHPEREQNVIGARSIRNAYLHRIKMAADVGGVDMGNWNVEARARTANLLRRRHNRLRAPEHVTHSVAAGHVPERPVFELSGRAHDRSLAVALDNFWIAAQPGYE